MVAAFAVGLAVLASGLVGGQPTTLDDGTAEIELVSPDADRLAIDDSRFGTAAANLRLPDLVVEVSNLTGRPRVVYTVAIPDLGLDRQRTRLIERRGRLRVPMADRAYAPGGPATARCPSRELTKAA